MISKDYFEFKKKIAQNYKETVGFELSVKEVKVNNKIIRLQMCGCSGNEIYWTLIQNFYRNSIAFLIFMIVTIEILLIKLNNILMK